MLSDLSAATRSEMAPRKTESLESGKEAPTGVWAQMQYMQVPLPSLAGSCKPMITKNEWEGKAASFEDTLVGDIEMNMGHRSSREQKKCGNTSYLRYLVEQRITRWSDHACPTTPHDDDFDSC